MDVARLGVDVECRPGRSGDEHRTIPRLEQLAHLGDQPVQRVLGGRGRTPPPELLDQPIPGHDLARAEKEQREQHLLPPARDHDLRAAFPDLKRAEDEELHDASLRWMSAQR